MLYIVPTPLGNLDDITLRATQTLESCDFIIAENPTITHKLLLLLKLPKKEVFQFAEHNEHKMLPILLDKLHTQVGCLVSDAGTPTISDPGFRLVRACRQENLEVVSLPGASAAITALAGSGLPTDKFLFTGFLAKTENKIVKTLTEAQQINATLVAYDSPKRILKTLNFIKNNFPLAHIVVARELTKKHEEYLQGTAQTLIEILSERDSIKGEVTLVVSFK
ncbi:MAG: 16S rRNA (cytidine(1402)-2'-O)-methyltransferase [Candidatus Doudnabacteria bacterium]